MAARNTLWFLGRDTGPRSFVLCDLCGSHTAERTGRCVPCQTREGYLCPMCGLPLAFFDSWCGHTRAVNNALALRAASKAAATLRSAQALARATKAVISRGHKAQKAAEAAEGGD